MPHLILVRHSITEQIPGIPSHQWTLTEEGRNRCRVLAEQLRPYRIALVASSDEPKALTTAELLAGHLQVEQPVFIEPDFGETRRESAPYFDDPTTFKSAIRSAMTHPNSVVFGEESFGEARLRFTRALYQFVTTHPEQTLAIVTHGTIMSLLLGHVTGDDPYATWHKLGMPAYAVLTPNLDLLDLQLSVP